MLTEPAARAARRVQEALRSRRLPSEVVEMPKSTRTARDAANAIGCRVEEIVKSLVFRRLDTGEPVLVVASGGNRVDERKLSALLGAPVEKASPDFVRESLGYAIGGVPPIGHTAPVPVWIDRSLLELETLWAAAGTPNAVFRLTPAELLRATDGTAADLAQDTLEIAAMRPSDWEEVRRIYAEGIATKEATFEMEPPTWEAWDRSHRPDGRLVARAGDRVMGWAALSRVSDRCVYGGVAEVSVYVAAEARGRGVGTALLSELIRASEEAGIWTLQAGIFPENRASIAIHERCGFRMVGVRERLGRLDGQWRDVALLERRSSRVG